MADEDNEKIEATKIETSDAIQQFILELSKMEYYDINEKKLKTFEFATRPAGAVPPARSAYVTEQEGETCASEAMSKCLTEIADSSELDVEMEEIRDTFINTVQPDRRAEHIHNFNHKSVFVRAWNKNKKQRKDIFNFLNFGVLVQHQVVRKPDFKGPKMTQDLLTKHRTRMIAVWKLGKNERGTNQGYHAVYVKDWEQKRGDYVFKCINSWGDKDHPTPQIEDKHIRDLYYISLYPVRCLVITSSGSDLDHMTSFGVYIETIDEENE